jgi:hypothetical protein
MQSKVFSAAVLMTSLRLTASGIRDEVLQNLCPIINQSAIEPPLMVNKKMNAQDDNDPVAHSVFNGMEELPSEEKAVQARSA